MALLPVSPVRHHRQQGHRLPQCLPRRPSPYHYTRSLTDRRLAAFYGRCRSVVTGLDVARQSSTTTGRRTGLQDMPIMIYCPLLCG
jgi:hypothetical protein